MSSILVILEKKPFGGAERATNLILKLLANHGFNLTVVTGDCKIEKISHVKWVYSPLLDVPSKFHLWTNLLTHSLSELVALIKQSDTVYFPRLAYPLIPIAKRYGKKTIVHLHDYQPLSCCAAVFPNFKTADIGLLSDMKTSLQCELLSTNSLQRASLFSLGSPFNRLCKVWLSYSDEIICVSKRQKHIFKEALPRLANKLRVIYNLLPEQALIKKDLSAHKSSVLFMGGDSYLKGFNMFLIGSTEILRKNYTVKYQVTRHFKSAKNRALIEALNERFNGAYNLLGQVGYEEVLRLHAKSSVVLFPSVWEEPLPYVVVESMLSGTLPVASRVGGVPEIVQNSFAEELLFTPGDVAEFVDRMDLALSLSKTQLTELGYQLREAALKRFGNEIIEPELSRLFLE